MKKLTVAIAVRAQTLKNMLSIPKYRDMIDKCTSMKEIENALRTYCKENNVPVINLGLREQN